MIASCASRYVVMVVLSDPEGPQYRVYNARTGKLYSTHLGEGAEAAARKTAEKLNDA